MLEAVAALPKEKYEVIVYTEKESLAELKDDELTTIYASTGLCGRAFCKALRMLGFPMKWYRSISPYFHPVVKKLLEQECDLWIFPSQDFIAYHAPLPALITIHDLMHRYEGKLPRGLGHI